MDYSRRSYLPLVLAMMLKWDDEPIEFGTVIAYPKYQKGAAPGT